MTPPHFCKIFKILILLGTVTVQNRVDFLFIIVVNAYINYVTNHVPHKGVLSPWEKLNIEWGLNRWYCRWFKYVEEVESIFGVAINLAGSVPRKMVYVLLSLFILFMLDQSRSLITVAHKRESKLWHPTHTLIPIRLYVLESKTDSVKSIPGFFSHSQSKQDAPSTLGSA